MRAYTKGRSLHFVVQGILPPVVAFVPANAKATNKKRVETSPRISLAADEKNLYITGISHQSPYIAEARQFISKHGGRIARIARAIAETTS